MDKLVVKYGRTSLQNEDGVGLDQDRVNKCADRLLEIHEPRGLAVVASGAVVVGREVATAMGVSGLSDTQYAMLGTAGSHAAWCEAFARHGILVAQLLVTHRELQDPGEGNHLRLAIESCFERGIVPHVNQNDGVSDEEMELYRYGGENDGLGAEVAILIGAEQYMMFTDSDGVMKSPEHVVSKLTLPERDYALSLVDDSMRGEGKGGMRTKIKAGFNFAEFGGKATISSADADYQAVLAGLAGTTILPEAA